MKNLGAYVVHTFQTISATRVKNEYVSIIEFGGKFSKELDYLLKQIVRDINKIVPKKKLQHLRQGNSLIKLVILLK